jgi:hypothetical protein
MARKKTKKELTPREVMFLKSFVRTGSQTTAAIASGSPEENARQCGWAMMRRIKGKIGERLAAKGITPDSLIDKVLLPGLEATKKERICYMGTVTQTFEDVDHEQRGKYADRILKLVGLVGNGHETGTEGDPQSRPGHISLTLVLPPGTDTRAFMDLGARSPANHQQPILDVESHEDEGRPGPTPTL